MLKSVSSIIQNYTHIIIYLRNIFVFSWDTDDFNSILTIKKQMMNISDDLRKWVPEEAERFIHKHAARFQ